MKGKIAFILGASIGYVLGSRAGRERYEQIKQGAITVWHTEPVQKGVDKVQSAVADQVEAVQGFVVGKSKEILHAATRPEVVETEEDAAESAAKKTSGAKRTPAKSSTTKAKSSTAKKSTSAKSAASKSRANKSGSKS